jgi:hypothetical protein
MKRCFGIFVFGLALTVGVFSQSNFVIPVPTRNTIDPNLINANVDTIERQLGRQLTFLNRDESYSGNTLVVFTEYLLQNFPDRNSNIIFGFLWDRFTWYEIKYDLDVLRITDKPNYLLRTVEQFNRAFGKVATKSDWRENTYDWEGALYASVSVHLEVDKEIGHTILIVSVWFIDGI